MYWRNFVLAAGFALFIHGSPAKGADNSERVQTLLHQLGNDSYSIRAAADAQLRKMGPAILPLLESANHDLDPESELRVEDMIHSMWRQIGKVVPTDAWLAKRPKLTRDFNTAKAALTVNIHEDADGIKLSYTAEQDGNLVEHYAAGTSPKELRDVDPKAFEAYWTIRGHTDDQSSEIVGAITSQQHAGKTIPGKPIANPDAVMRTELDNSDLTPDQKQAIEKAIDGAAEHRARDGSPNAQ
jgi:hypothetical protein